MAKSASTKLKQLPRGEGNMSITKVGTIEYKKVIKLEDGSHVRKSVNGKTQRECLDKMKALETQILKEGPKKRYRRILKDELLFWLEKVKKPVLKVQSYQRLKSTIKNQIINSPIGHLRYQSVRTEELQNLMDILNEAGLRHSTIKKTYDCLNEFYRYVSARDKFDNPMLLVIMPTVNNVHAVSKEISFFEEDDIKKMIEEAGIRYHTGRLKYRYGYIICANMYLGLRIGELLALKWKDIDLDNGTIYISKTLIEYENPKYDKTNVDMMKKKGIKRVLFEIQHSTKKSKNRYVPISSKAMELIQLYIADAQYTDPEDYVISTRNRKTNTAKNISDVIKLMEKNAGTEVKDCNTHVLRHTCASLYFRAGNPTLLIAEILGNSVEVLEKTYIHFVEEQMQQAAATLPIHEI